MPTPCAPTTRCVIAAASPSPGAGRSASDSGFLVEHFEETIGRIPVDAQAGNQGAGLAPAQRRRGRAPACRAALPMFVSEVPACQTPSAPAAIAQGSAGGRRARRDPRVAPQLEKPRVSRSGRASARLAARFAGSMAARRSRCRCSTLSVAGARGLWHLREHLLDYDAFSIPYSGCFDLVVANHLVTHAVRPQETLKTIRERLSPGGHLYLYNEPDEGRLPRDGQVDLQHAERVSSPDLRRRVVGTRPSVRWLRAGVSGTTTTTASRLARVARMVRRGIQFGGKSSPRRAAPVRRRATSASSRFPERLRGLFTSEWDAVVQSAFAAKTIDFDGDGNRRC